jgi:H+/Na+-translocating ferredoxin:NAD+ oxidoreductase subunit C
MAFKGGIHPQYNKITAGKKIEGAKIPGKIILPISQHVGAPCDPIVNIGDYVKTGQKVAESKAFVSAPIHSSISGTVKSIENLPHPITGKPVKSIVIESDGKDDKVEMNKREYDNLSVDELKSIIKDAGIVGLGGAAFPTHVKLSPPPDKKIDTLLINGAECEPFLTTDYRLMIEKSNEMLAGIRLMRKILGVKDTFIGIEDNKQDAANLLLEKAAGQNIQVVSLHTKYPQGGEKNLIYAITKRKVPAGGLPMEVGCVVSNVGTAIAVYEAVAFSKPLYERVVTVTGKVNDPKNLLVRNGTLVNELIEQAGGYKDEPQKLIMGGPMMGFALSTDELPVIKGTSGLTVFNKEDIDSSRKTIECIRCGKCVENCPMNLQPALIAKYAQNEKIDMAEETYVMDCYECGCCSFNCPSHIPLVHWIRYAKSQILKKRVDAKEKEKKEQEEKEAKKEEVKKEEKEKEETEKEDKETKKEDNHDNKDSSDEKKDDLEKESEPTKEDN